MSFLHRFSVGDDSVAVGEGPLDSDRDARRGRPKDSVSVVDPSRGKSFQTGVAPPRDGIDGHLKLLYERNETGTGTLLRRRTYKRGTLHIQRKNTKNPKVMDELIKGYDLRDSFIDSTEDKKIYYVSKKLNHPFEVLGTQRKMSCLWTPTSPLYGRSSS